MIDMIIFGVGRKSFKYSLALESRGKSGRDLKKKNARQVVKKLNHKMKPFSSSNDWLPEDLRFSWFQM